MAAIAESVVTREVGRLADTLVDQVVRACRYVICYDRYLRKLEDEAGNLDGAMKRVQDSVNKELRNMRRIQDDVNKWVTDAESLASEARDLLERDKKAEKTCFFGCIPNPKAHHDLAKEATEIVEAIKELMPKGQFNKVPYENAPRGLVGRAADLNSSAADWDNIITGSRASIFQDIMQALDDDELKVIGVYGPGGVGKTSLLKEVEKKLRKAGRPFNMIVKAEVSRTPDLDNIRDQIADYLGLHLKQEQSPQGRRDLLLERLKKDPNEKILIILDDLWKELDLEKVGIPNGDESSGCKLLLSSRSEDVLKKRMNADRTFPLEGLNNNEAFRLFEKTVGDKLQEDEELKAKADQVVRKLAGLPLLIESIASTLKYSPVSAWDSMLIKIEDPNTERIVKWSYDHLESEDAKKLFLLCGLIGGTIPVELLLGLGMGLGLFVGYNQEIKSSRGRLSKMLDCLRSVCLLQGGGDDKENVTIHDLYSEAVVSTSFEDQNFLMMNNNSWSEEKLEKCSAICLRDVGSDRLAELMRCSEFPNLKILMLSQPEVPWWAGPAHQHVGDFCRLDFTHMKQLRVLYIRSMHILPNLPSSIQILQNLRSLYLDHCDVEDVAILGELEALQILSFVGSTISKLPIEIRHLTKLKSLDLTYCSKLAIIEPGVLEGLINLEELLMRYSFDQWMGNDEVPLESCNAKLAELKSLTKLTALEISIPDPAVLLEAGDLPFGNLIRFWINIGSVYAREFEGLRTMKLKLKRCDSILSKEWIQKTLHKTQHLHLVGLGESKENALTFCNAHELCTQGFPQLKHLDIENSPSIEYIASSSGGIPLTAFPKLESLHLEKLINLEKICHGLVAPECLSKLKDVNIKYCNRLKYSLCLSQMQRFVHLEEIEVWGCESMRAIVIDDAREDIAIDDIVELPNVHRLDLVNLPRMTSFCIEAGTTLEGAPIKVTTSFSSLESLFNCGPLHSNTKQTRILLPKLEKIFVESCPTMQSLFDCGSLHSNTERTILSLPKLEVVRVRRAGMLSHVVKSNSQMVWDFPSLKEVCVEFCSELRYLFPYFTAATLRKLEMLYISHCRQMKAVVPKEEGGRSKADVMSFPSLTYLRIRQCRDFGAFIASPPSAKKLLGETAEEDDESPQPLFNEMVAFPNLRKLEIGGVQCEELWSNQIPNDSFCNLGSLELEHCKNLQFIAPSYMWKRLQHCLEILKVSSCRLIKIIYKSDGTDTKSGKLRRLVLRDLQNLRHIWQSDGHPYVLLPNLRFIEVQSCPRLRMLFPSFTPEFLGQIEELVVESCEDTELIAGHEECEEVTGTAIIFSELIALRLFELPKFKSFLPEKYSVEFPSLQVLSKASCGTESDQCLGDWGSYQQRRESEIRRASYHHQRL